MKVRYYYRLMTASFVTCILFLLVFIVIGFRGVNRQAEFSREEKNAREVIIATDEILEKLCSDNASGSINRQQLQQFIEIGLRYASDSASVIQFSKLVTSELTPTTDTISAKHETKNGNKSLLRDSVFAIRNKIVQAQRATIAGYDILETENRWAIFILIGLTSIMALLVFVGFWCLLKKNIDKRIAAEEQLITANQLLESNSQRALLAERNMSQAIISGLPGVFVMFDSNNRIVRWNKNTEVLSGYTPAEIRHMKPLDFLDQDERETLEKLNGEVFEKGYGEIETNFVNKKGEKTPYSFRGYVSEIEGQPFFIGWGFDIARRKKAEQLARNEQILTESIINSLPGIFYLDDDQGNVIRWNRNAEQVTGYTKLEAGEMNALEFLAEEDRPKLMEKIKETFATGTSELEANLLTKSGQKIPYYFNGNAAVFNGRKHLIGIGIDVSARKKAESDLLESEQKYRVLFYNNPLPMFMVSLPGYGFIDANEAALKLYGYSHAEFLKMNVFDIRIPEEQERFEREVRPVTLKGTNFRGKWTHRKKSGERFLVDIATHDVDFSGQLTRLILVNDVTERERAFEKVRQSEERLRHTMDNMLEGAQILGFDWRYLYVNDAAVKQNKYSREELLGFTWMEKYPGLEQSYTYKMLQKCMDERVPLHLINEFTFPDGSSGWFELSIQPVPEGIFILSVDISERKKAEDDLHKIVTELTDYKFALDQSAIVAITNQYGIITYANDNFCRVSKYKREELLGADHRILNSGYHGKDIMRDMWQTIAGGKIWKGEFKNKAKDGTFYWVDTTIVPFLNAQGKPYQYLAIRKEITERKKAEEELRLSESKLNDAQALAHMGSFDMDITTGVVEWSEEMFNLLGYKKGEVTASNQLLLSMVHADDSAWVNRLFNETFTTFKNATNNFRLVSSNGAVRYCFCEWKFEFDHLHQPVRVYGFVQDITDQKENEEQIFALNQKLVAANNQLEIILNTLPANIALLDGSGKIVAVNKAWQSFAEANNMQGSHYGVGDNYMDICRQAKGEDENVALKMAEGIKNVLSGEIGEVALEYPCHSPEEQRWFRVEVRPLKDNMQAGAVIMHVSITDRMKAEMAIIEMNNQLEQKVIDRTIELTEANKALEAFSYSVSHDLKAPVRAINGFVKIIQKEYGAGFTPDLQELFEHIDSSGRRMSAIIDDMLTLAKYEKVKLNPVKVDMAKLFNNVWDNIYFAAPHRATIKLTDLPVVEGDSSMLEQVVVNLLSNAVKYSSKKERPQISIGCQKTDTTVTFFVKDNGAGFDMKNYDRLFGAFQRLHGSSEFEGTGVGLLLVKRIIEKHGGIVWAEGKVNEGATFYFTLPLLSNY